MKADLAARIESNPKFRELVRKRAGFGWLLSALMMCAYFGYILLVAFDKELLARKLGAGVTSLGIPLGLAVILFTIGITAVYVRRANSEFDAMSEEIVKEATK